MNYSPEYVELKEALSTLEARLARVEAALHVEAPTPSDEAEESSPREETAQAEALEFRIGQYWFAKLGIVTLAMGIVFFLTLDYPSLHPALPSLFGYVIAGCIIYVAHRWRAALQHISGYLLGGGIVLMYVASLRLHFFSATPALDVGAIITALLAACAAAGLYISKARMSPYLIAVSLSLGYGAALVADNAFVLVAGITILSVFGIFFAVKNEWHALLVFTAALNVITHLLWFLNAPILGRPVHLVEAPYVNIFFVLIYMITVSAGTLWKKGQEGGITTLTSVVNGVGGYMLFLFLTLTQFKSGFVAVHLLASLVLLAVAILFWKRERSMYSTFIYVMLGYMAMSVAIIAQFKTPDHFIWLSWQSIIVVSTAVWFRSRFIVVANFFIYLMLFMTYLVLAGKINVVSLSFGVVALLSARILNAQKHRLELKTEFMRNAYLAAAFCMFPYALYHIVPQGLISLSWLMVALFYYGMARTINSSKYRWMALLTLMLTVVHVLAIDIRNLEAAYKVVSFVVLGVVLLVISLAYARRKPRQPSVNNQPKEVPVTSRALSMPPTVPASGSTEENLSEHITHNKETS